MSKDEQDTGAVSFDIEDRRRLKHMAYVTSGCGKNKEKDRIVNVFWEETWPKLEKQGWKKVRKMMVVSLYLFWQEEATYETMGA